MNVLQIPRDCYMPAYANTSTNKFNSIYGTGQDETVTPIQRAVNAIQESFGLVIDCYVKLSCTDIANIVDSIGGIPIDLPEEIMYEADKVLKPGKQTLNGQQAEWFVRFRREYDEGDIGRVKAQRIFLAAAMQKLLDMSQTELMSAMQKIYKNEWIATDLSLEQISMLADFAAKRLTMDGVNVYMVPGEGIMYEGRQFIRFIRPKRLTSSTNISARIRTKCIMMRVPLWNWLMRAIILTPIRIQKKIWATSTTEILRMENRIFTAMETKENHHQHERIIISWSRKQY